jgi:hypothetical protein
VVTDGPKRKAIDWKPQLVVLTIPPSTEAVVITIDVQPGAGRAYAYVPHTTDSQFIKPLTPPTKTEKI